jgi:hypothetical protein
VRTVEPAEATVDRERPCKYNVTAKLTYATIEELLEAVFSMRFGVTATSHYKKTTARKVYSARSVSRLCNED